MNMIFDQSDQMNSIRDAIDNIKKQRREAMNKFAEEETTKDTSPFDKIYGEEVEDSIRYGVKKTSDANEANLVFYRSYVLGTPIEIRSGILGIYRTDVKEFKIYTFEKGEDKKFLIKLEYYQDSVEPEFFYMERRDSMRMRIELEDQKLIYNIFGYNAD